MPEIYLEIDASGAVRGIKQYTNAADDGADATDKLAKKGNILENGFDSIAKKAIGVAGALLSIKKGLEESGKAVNIFAGFDDSLRVAASYAGILNDTTEEFKVLGDAAKEAGATTSKTAAESAQALGELTSRGFSAKQAVAALIPTIRLAEAAQGDLAKAAAVSSGVMSGLGKDVDYLSRINDVIVGISGRSSLNLDKFGEVAKGAIPAARAAGEELETVAAVTGVLVDQQIEAGAAGNAFNKMLISLIAPSSRAAAQLNAMGISTKDAQGNFVGIIPIMQQLKNAGLGLSGSVEIFGREWASEALIVSNSIDEVKKDYRELKADIDGVSESAAKFQQGGIGGEFRKLGSAVESVYLAVGEQLAPIVQDVTVYLAYFATNAGKVAGATSLIITGAQVLANIMLGLYNAVDIVNDGVTGLFSFAVNNSPLYRGLELIAGGLVKIGAIDVNPFESARKGITEFAKAQDGSFERVQDRVSALNAQFDKYRRNLQENLKSTRETEAAERSLKVAAEAAATSAGKQAIAAGKSTQEALSAAEAARKAYMISAQAANEQKAADEKAAVAAEKRRAALEKQAKQVKDQALSYGATEEAAQAAADKLLEAGNAANGITGAGPDALNSSLDETRSKAGQAKEAISGIGQVGIPTGGGGEISYSVGLSTGDYERKVTELKSDIRALNNDYQVKINFDPAGAELLRDELDSARKKLEDTEAIQGYNEQLRSLQAQYREVQQEFLGGKLTIVTDQEAAANIRSQIAAVTDLKLSVDGVIPGMERVNGIWQQLPNSVATGVQPAVTSLGSLANASGEIETQWKLIDGVWKETLSDGTVLVEGMNGALSAGKEIAGQFGAAVAGAASSANGGLSEVEKILQNVEKQIVSTEKSAGNMKLDQLAAQSGALVAVENQIKELDKSLKGLDPSSEKAAAAMKRLFTLEAVKGDIQSKISELKNEIYDTGKESEETGKKAADAAEKIASIPKATTEAAAAVKNLAQATGELAKTQGDVAREAWGREKTFTFTSSNTIDGINAEIAALKEEQRIIEEMNDIIFGRQSDFTGINRSAQDLQQQQINELEAKKIQIQLQGYIDSKIPDIMQGSIPSIDQPQSITTNNNFYGYDRSDAAAIIERANRSARRS